MLNFTLLTASHMVDDIVGKTKESSFDDVKVDIEIREEVQIGSLINFNGGIRLSSSTIIVISRPVFLPITKNG